MKLNPHVSGSVDSILTTISYNLTLAEACACNAAYSACCMLQDNEVMEQVDRDVMRTHPDMHFFSGEARNVTVQPPN
jgi:hypothetical protein